MRRAWVGFIGCVIACVLAATLVASAGGASGSEKAKLYYVQGSYLKSISATGGSTARKTVARLPTQGAEALALGGGRVFIASADAIWTVSLRTGRTKKLVRGLHYPSAVAYSAGHVYFEDSRGIGRVLPDGAKLQRNFIRLSAENGGGVTEGLAIAGNYIYFTRCQDDAIGKATLDGGFTQQQFILLAAHDCPQGLAAGGGYLYFTELGISPGTGRIGRVRVGGADIETSWLTTTSDALGPYAVAVAGSSLFWTHDEGAGGSSYIGRVRTDLTKYSPAFLKAPSNKAIGLIVAG